MRLVNGRRQHQAFRDLRGIRLPLLLFLIVVAVGFAHTRTRKEAKSATSASSALGLQSPPPGASVQVPIQVPASLNWFPFDSERFLTVPPNFTVSVFARIDDPRRMAFAPNGDLLVSQPNDGNVALIRPNPGSAPSVFTYVSGLSSPHGIVFHTAGDTTYVYISESNQIDRYIYNTGDTAAHDGEVVVPNLPDGNTPGLSGYEHPLKNIAMDSNDKLYVSIGSSCNVCTSDTVSNPLHAAIYQYNADGTGGRNFARGLRNAEGLALLPGTTDLWVVVNERDDIAYPFKDSSGQYGLVVPSYVDNHPPDEFTRVVDGGNYGWPFCDPDPDTARGLQNMPFDNDYQMNQSGQINCGSMNSITQGIQAHSAPLSLLFLQETAFPQPYQDGAVVCLHGSWDRETKTGYKLAYFPWNDAAGVPGTQIDFVTGWLDNATQQEWGRPVDAVVDQAGNLYISDDLSGTVYEMSSTVKISPSPTPPMPTPSPAPTITAAVKRNKNIVVSGQNFASGAIVLVNGQPVRTISPDGQPDTLIARKAVKVIPHNQTASIQVKNPNGAVSSAFPFTRD